MCQAVVHATIKSFKSVTATGCRSFYTPTALLPGHTDRHSLTMQGDAHNLCTPC